MPPPETHRIVVGLGFGDESKGATVDFLARTYNYQHVVRYNGGAQAAHHVVLPDGRTHCFSQVGSAAMQPGVHTYLSRHVVVDPLSLHNELVHLSELGFTDCAQRQVIDGRATIVTPYHKALNRIEEMCRTRRHGSCGLGIGVAHLDRQLDRLSWLEARHLKHKNKCIQSLEQIRKSTLLRASEALRGASIDISMLAPLSASDAVKEEIRAQMTLLQDPSSVAYIYNLYEKLCINTPITIDDEGHVLEDVLRTQGVLFEGAQGVLLDPHYGYFPHVTATRTTPALAHELVHESHSTLATHTIGVMRAYHTRHGAGPFPSEHPQDFKHAPHFKEKHNAHNPWQHGWRTGWLDETLLRYASHTACAGQLDALAISHIDVLCTSQELFTVSHDTEQTHEEHAKSDFKTDTYNTKEQRLLFYPHKVNYNAHARLHKNVREKLQRGQLCDTLESYLSLVTKCAGVPVSYLGFGPSYQDRNVV